jgi:hypothetical protein
MDIKYTHYVLEIKGNFLILKKRKPSIGKAFHCQGFTGFRGKPSFLKCYLFFFYHFTQVQ